MFRLFSNMFYLFVCFYSGLHALAAQRRETGGTGKETGRRRQRRRRGGGAAAAGDAQAHRRGAGPPAAAVRRSDDGAGHVAEPVHAPGTGTQARRLERRPERRLSLRRHPRRRRLQERRLHCGDSLFYFFYI